MTAAQKVAAARMMAKSSTPDAASPPGLKRSVSSKERAEQAAELARKESKKLVFKTFCFIVLCPLRLTCCMCSSIGGVLTLMRSENTREFALAVVIGNAFERYVATISEFVITPMFHAATDVFISAKPPTRGFVNGVAGGFMLMGGSYYTELMQNGTVELWSGEPYYLTNDAARDDGAKVIDTSKLINGTLSFVLSLLNICNDEVTQTLDNFILANPAFEPLCG